MDDIPTPEPTELGPEEPFVKPRPPSNGTKPSRRGPFARAMMGADPKPKVVRERTLGKRGQFVKPLEEMYAGIAMMLSPLDPQCAKVIMQQAPACARAWDEAAYQNETVRRMVESFVTTSVFGMVMVAHAPIMLTAAMHHSPALQARMASGFGDVIEKQMREQADDAG
jgi:hypothetical protein